MDYGKTGTKYSEVGHSTLYWQWIIARKRAVNLKNVSWIDLQKINDI